MSKMGLHDPFEHLKHKLWAKEGPEIKLTIWFPTTKSWELPRFDMQLYNTFDKLKNNMTPKTLTFDT